MVKSLPKVEITPEMRKKYLAGVAGVLYGKGGVYDVTYTATTQCTHLENGWYDWIDYWWGRQLLWVCKDCDSVIKLKKNQKIGDVRK
jgi:hypothetical protein